MHTFIEKNQSFIRLVIVLAAIFLFAAALVQFKQLRYVGSGITATNTITVSGTGKIMRAPDTAKISFTVSDEQKEVKVAQDNVSKKVDAATKALKALGIEEKHIVTDSYTSYPQYTYPEVVCMATSCPKPGTPTLRGYQVSHSVTVSVKNLDTVPQVLGVLANVAVTHISGPNFGFEDDKAVAREARDLAIEDARKEAQKLAKSLGVRVVRIVSFSENGGGYPSPLYARDAMMAKTEVAGAAPSLPVGEQNITSNVTVVYEIQ